MRIIPLLVILLVSVCCIYAQNKVPNPGFEDTLFAAEESPSQLECIDHWFNPTASTPDYFVGFAGCEDQLGLCGSCISSSIVQTAFEAPLALEGEDYVGIYCYQLGSETRDYVGIQLEEPLVGGVIYEVSMYVYLPAVCQFKCSGMGIHLSLEPVTDFSTWNHLSEIAQVEYTGLPIAHDDGWVQVTGLFEAVGGEEYLTIGNFHDDSETEFEYTGQGNFNAAYYFLDNVRVSQVTETNEIVPSNAKMTYSSRNNSLIVDGQVKGLLLVYSLDGRIIKQAQLEAHRTEITVAELESGVYLVVYVGADFGLLGRIQKVD